MSANAVGFSATGWVVSKYVDTFVLNSRIPTGVKNFAIRPLSPITYTLFGIGALIETILRLAGKILLFPCFLIAYTRNWYSREFSLLNPESGLRQSLREIVLYPINGLQIAFFPQFLFNFFLGTSPNAWKKGDGSLQKEDLSQLIPYLVTNRLECAYPDNKTPKTYSTVTALHKTNPLNDRQSTVTALALPSELLANDRIKAWFTKVGITLDFSI